MLKAFWVLLHNLKSISKFRSIFQLVLCVNANWMQTKFFWKQLKIWQNKNISKFKIWQLQSLFWSFNDSKTSWEIYIIFDFHFAPFHFFVSNAHSSFKVHEIKFIFPLHLLFHFVFISVNFSISCFGKSKTII